MSMPQPVTSFEACLFETDRLLVKEWHAPPRSDWPEVDLGHVVAGLLTEPVTRHLPDAWRGPLSVAEARAWVVERDTESPTLLVVDKTSAEPVGMIIVYESAGDTAEGEPGGGSDVRLGYLLAEHVWGQGLARELLGGFVDWCRHQPTIDTITAGVASANEASQRVLERLGFAPLAATPDGELVYRLAVRG